LENYGWLAWIGVALAFAAVEAATVDFVFLMLAGGALGGSAASALGAPFVVQVLVAVAMSGVLLGVGRPWAKRRFAVRPAGVAMGTAGYIGRSAFVLETVTQHGGRVKVGGETWSATTNDPVPPEPGDEVRVVRIDGATAVVTRVAPVDHIDHIAAPPHD
jgi:membrane protein implicated in regulation of membrane protease activity